MVAIDVLGRGEDRFGFWQDGYELHVYVSHAPLHEGDADIKSRQNTHDDGSIRRQTLALISSTHPSGFIGHRLISLF